LAEKLEDESLLQETVDAHTLQKGGWQEDFGFVAGFCKLSHASPVPRHPCPPAENIWCRFFVRGGGIIESIYCAKNGIIRGV